jgi:hypothetical protein
MRCASAVAGPKAFGDHLRPRLCECLSIQHAFGFPERGKYPDTCDPSVTQVVINIPEYFLVLSSVPGQATFHAVQGTARIDI